MLNGLDVLANSAQQQQHRQPPLVNGLDAMASHPQQHQRREVNGLDILASISSSESAAPGRHNYQGHHTYHPCEIDCARKLASLPSYNPTPTGSPRDMSFIAGLFFPNMKNPVTRTTTTGFHSPSATTISASSSTESPTSRASIFDFNLRGGGGSSSSGGHYDPSSSSSSGPDSQSSAVETTRTTPEKDKIGELIECLDQQTHNQNSQNSQINSRDYEEALFPAPRPDESTMPCREAFSIVRKIHQTAIPDGYLYDADGHEAESVARQYWAPGFRSASAAEPGSGCRVQTQLVYEYVDHMTGP